MNIWYISAYDAPNGVASRTYDYAVELTGLGHHITIFTSSYSHFTHREHLQKGEKWREEWFGGIRVIWLKTIPYEDNGLGRGLNMLSNAWRALQVGRTIRPAPDVIFGPSVPLFTGLSACLLSRILNSKFCFEVRDIWPQALIDIGALSQNSPITLIFRMIERILYHRADRIIAVLPFAYRHICRCGVNRSSIEWVPNGVRLARFKDCAPFDGGKPDSLVVAYAGGGSKYGHDLDVILEAAKILQDEGVRGVRFVIIGGGNQSASISTRAQHLGVKDFELRPAVPKAEIPKELNTADLLVASVKDTPVYQFGINSNKIFDYLGSGRPIIFAGKSANDPVADANAGVTIPPEDPRAMSRAILAFLKMDPAERKRLGDNGLQYAREHLDTAVLARKLENILLDLEA
ncbi:MAG TPA: glycosyltransferase family 4 protein [Syntrophobacteraceae bacterium]|nr:glycosyltransferase family 4 protein [Syntrophobacteraceae bacterium]